jgi:hypothetical protein
MFLAKGLLVLFFCISYRFHTVVQALAFINKQIRFHFASDIMFTLRIARSGCLPEAVIQIFSLV